MEIYLNLIFAWISVLLAVLLSVIFVMRVIIKKNTDTPKLKKVNRFLRKHHKLLGILLVGTGFIHGYFSSEKILSFNIGTLSWVVSILLGINWMIRSKLSKWKGWMFYHRLMTLIFIATIVIHVIDVGGIQIQNILFADNSYPIEDNSHQQVTHIQTETEPETESQTSEATGESSSDTNESTDVATESTSETSTEATTNVTTEATTNATTESTTKATTESTTEATIEATTEAAHGIYKDGVYTGEADGFRPGLIVEVEIKDDQIIRIDVIDHNEVNSRYYGRPVAEIPAAIIDAQNTNVDAVSGATYTSIGIMNAVENALAKAKW